MINHPDLFEREYSEPFGTDPEKLVRHLGPTTSVEAACSINTTVLERMVYNAIKSFGTAGAISDEIRQHHSLIDLSYSSVTARYRALLDKRYIIETGDKRKGDSGRSQRVLRALK